MKFKALLVGLVALMLGGCASMNMDTKTNLPKIYSGKTVRGWVVIANELDVFYKVGPPFYFQEVVFPKNYSLDPRRTMLIATTKVDIRDEFSKVEFLGGPNIMATMFGPENELRKPLPSNNPTAQEIYDSLPIGALDVVEWEVPYSEDIETTGNGTDNRKAIYHKHYPVARLVCKRADKECNADPTRGGTYGIVDPVTKRASSPQ